MNTTASTQIELARLANTTSDGRNHILTLDVVKESGSGVVEHVEEESNHSSNTSNQSSLSVTSAELLQIIKSKQMEMNKIMDNEK